MITTLLALSAIQKTMAAPLVPAGASVEFHAAILAVEDQLEVGNFDAARKLIAFLPRNNIRIAYDDSKVPASLRAEYRDAVNKAVAGWERVESNIHIGVVAKDGDLKIDFEPLLPVPPSRALPAPSTIFFSGETKGARVESVIGLRRGSPAVPTTPTEIQNEIGFAIGSYYGLAPEPLTASVMGRDDLTGQREFFFSPHEAYAAKRNLAAVQSLTTAVLGKKKVTPSRPAAFLDPKVLSGGRPTQGDTVNLSIQVTNRGTGPLIYLATPDCSCISAGEGKTIAPGTSALIPISVSTLNLDGDFNKRVIVASNDVDRPYVEVPLKLHVKPLYRFVGPPLNGYAIQDNKHAFDVILWVAEGAKLKPTRAVLTLTNSKVIFTPWSGSIVDIEHGEKTPVHRSGYKFHVEVDPKETFGRMMTALKVITDDMRFHQISYTVWVQRGIVATPQQLFMGSLSPLERDFVVTVNRPNIPFKIRRVEVDSPHVTVIAHGQGSEHKVVLRYDGKGDSGVLKGTLVVHTDDADQPVIKVPYMATIP